MPLRGLLVTLMLLGGLGSIHAQEPETIDDAWFTTHVEPLLKEHCYGCHSHSAGTMEGGLTLDWRSGWMTGGYRGPAIVPNDPDASLLIQAVRHTHAELKMPEEQLPDAELALLERWVAGGAPDPRTTQPQSSLADATDWWSLRPLVRPAVPPSKEAGATHPIDTFLDVAIVREGLTPAPPAERTAWLRRLTFDLHGLPPTLEEVAEYLADQSPEADSRQVERLLASPRYGERWARHWLDTIHFADSHGFEHDVFRPQAWRYRDYVIDRLNQDIPWDRFLREQLAVDVFFPEQPELTPALGFLGAGTYDHSAAITAPQSFEYLDRDDLVTQTMGAIVSTTANCARCHAHKFDPITQEDYFALQAVFAGIGKGNIPYDTDPRIARERTRWRTWLAAAETNDEALLTSPEAESLVAAWEEDQTTGVRWRTLTPEVFTSSDGAQLQRQADESLLSTGPRPERDVVTVTARVPVTALTAIRLDVLTDPSLPQQGPGRCDNGNLHLSEFELELFPPGATEGRRLKIGRATADFDQTGWTIQHAIDGNPATAWGIHPAVGQAHLAVFELAERLEVPVDATLALRLKQVHGGSHLIGRMKLSVTDGPPDEAVALPLDVEQALTRTPAERTTEARRRLAAAVLRHRAQRELAKLPEPTLVYAAAPVATNERGVIKIETPRTIHRLRRGDIAQPLEVIGPGALSAITALPARFELPPDSGEEHRRAALADWLASPENPLTWRSIANRVWHYHFGRGLCDTPNDFGRMGGLPSHPELLDWLACELRETGSLKRLHRLICTSAAYRRSSVVTAETLARDPDNRWLARMTRQRLDADSYRDALLTTSGKLDLKMGGPGIAYFSTSPGAQLTPILDYGTFDWDGPGSGRRSIYRVVWRGIPDPLMEALDFPDLGLLSPVRGVSLSPLQSLVLLNNRFVLHQAEALGRRAESVTTERPEQVRQMVRWAWLRDPTSLETAELSGLAERHGLAAVARLLFNSHEFLFVD